MLFPVVLSVVGVVVVLPPFSNRSFLPPVGVVVVSVFAGGVLGSDGLVGGVGALGVFAFAGSVGVCGAWFDVLIGLPPPDCIEVDVPVFFRLLVDVGFCGLGVVGFAAVTALVGEVVVLFTVVVGFAVVVLAAVLLLPEAPVLPVAAKAGLAADEVTVLGDFFGVLAGVVFVCALQPSMTKQNRRMA